MVWPIFCITTYIIRWTWKGYWFFLTLEVDINQRDQSHLKDRKQYKTRNKSTTYKYGH